MVESINSMQIGGVVRLTRKILYGTLLLRIGCIVPCHPVHTTVWLETGAYFSVFHSISAFCNAGFDLLAIIIPLWLMLTTHW